VGGLRLMCKRFTLWSAWSDIHGMYRLADVIKTGLDTKVRFDIAPTDDVLFVTAGEKGYSKLREGRWGLVPWWAKEVPEQVMSNARVEIVDTSSAFKDAWGSKRCLIPADGFYATGKDGDSWFIHQPGGRPFSFAGLWAHNARLGITSCSIITKRTAEPMQVLDDRQPVVLSPDVYEAWLDRGTPARDVGALLDRNLDGTLEFHRIRYDEDADDSADDSSGKAVTMKTASPAWTRRVASHHPSS
jgi:putative SOS response-associated peptidase YedK